MIEREISGLKDYEKIAVWFQTDAGLAWPCSEPEDRDEEVFIDENVVNHIAAALYAASDFERSSIREYLDRSQQIDD